MKPHHPCNEAQALTITVQLEGRPHSAKGPGQAQAEIPLEEHSHQLSSDGGDEPPREKANICFSYVKQFFKSKLKIILLSDVWFSFPNIILNAFHLH